MARRGASRSGFPSKVRRSTKLPRAGSNPASAQSGSASPTTQLLRRAAAAPAWSAGEVRADAAARLVMARTIPVPRLLEPVANRIGGLEPQRLDFGEVVSAIALAV